MDAAEPNQRIQLTKIVGYDLQRLTSIGRFVLFFTFAAVFGLGGVVPAHAFGETGEVSISYHIGWQEPNSHLLEITMHIRNDRRDSVDVSLPAWRPGRYVIQNFARNLVTLNAMNQQEQPLRFRKLDKDTWRIYKQKPDDTVLRYTIYARQLDGGSSYLDDAEAYINPVTCCLYVDGAEMQSVSLTFKQPQGWKVAGALTFDETLDAYRFDNYHELVDTPIIISAGFTELAFQHKGAEFRIVLQGDVRLDEEKLTGDIEKIVAKQIEMMKDIPFRRYYFLYHLVAKPFGHGVEHKNSTSIVVGPADFDDEKFYRRFLSVTSHEFFHVWNVERIRPQALFYPDYSRENYTTTLWLYEGFTSYYGGLTLRRAQLLPEDKYLQQLADQIKRYEHTYGTRVTDVEQVSWDSWTKGYGGAPPNSSYSFYAKGSLLAMLLDLQIRHVSENRKSLDDVMREFNLTYAVNNVGVPEDGLRAAVESVAGGDFRDFFENYVSGTDSIDFNQHLNHAGLELRKEPDAKIAPVLLGIKTRDTERGTVISNVWPGSPAFRAGLDVDDVLLAIDGYRADHHNLNRILKRYVAGDTVRVAVFHRDRLTDTAVVLREAPATKYQITKRKRRSKLQKKILRAWLDIRED